MKPLILFILLIMLFCLNFSGIAQAPDNTNNRIKQLKEALKLSDDQAAKINGIFSKNQQHSPQTQSAKPINKRTILMDTEKRLAAEDKEIEKLLTPEQIKKYESYKKERHNKLRSRNQGRKFKE